MKHISQVDNVDNLRALVRHELRELGIKLPKIKKSKRGASKHDKAQQDVVKSTLFGSYLAHAHCVHIPDCGYVAKFLVDAAEIVKANINCEGIFRKSGAVSRQKEIKQQLENGLGFSGANVHDVTAIVKQFFRELPEPLLTSSYHNTFIRCYQMEETSASVRAILLLCLLLPGEHISTLRFMMRLLANVAANSDANKMDKTNLALVLAPNIMHVNSKTETMKSCEEKLLQVQTSVVELLIEHAEEVGMVSAELVERTAFMSEVFSTDDELDASEDNLEDTAGGGETRGRGGDTQAGGGGGKKEKKRKRSGSFQGFVSSIAQSITKWRRSTDGKTNTSNLSQCSNASQVSASEKKPESRHDTGKHQQPPPAFQFTVGEATPVVRRKKVAGQTSESRAFSASKKKAILKNLPQQTTLASTPFTPANGMKRMDINSIRRAGNLETPNMPPRPYQCTPRVSMKTPRKKLTLFSPASTTKKKRYSSTTNLSLQSASKKATKSKGILRRLSGSRGDQVSGGASAEAGNRQQIGHRLASPKSPGTDTAGPAGQAGKNIKDHSPIAALAQNASFSSSVCEQSVVSNFEDDRRSLNDGFIVTDDKEVDISRIMSEPALAGSHESGEYVMLGDVRPRESVSETTILGESQFETPTRAHSRSYSMDSILDSSSKRSSLKRGQPNSLKAGLLQGDQREVSKLRRSFGLDKSDIGFPVPISVANTSNCDQYIQLDTTLDDLVGSKGAANKNDGVNNAEEQDSPGSVSRNKVSTTSVAESMTGYECDDERSETGFSVVSSSTAMKHQTIQAPNGETSSAPENSGAKLVTPLGEPEGPGQSSSGLDIKKTLADQKQESKDSLLSATSVSLTPPPVSGRDREMTRSVSADSGKGSLYEEPMDEGADQTLDSITSSILDKEISVVTNMDSTTDKLSCTQDVFTSAADSTNVSLSMSDMTVTSSVCETLSDVEGFTYEAPTLPSVKSVSSQDLTRDCEPTPTRVSRSKSLLETSLAQRKLNVKPNLQISAETHKLLARAGYIKDNSFQQQEETDDFPVSGALTFPAIKQTETEAINPRRESIIALRKNNAGYVKSNIKQFDKISGNDVVTRHVSPLRFPNSTSRKKGVSPLKIPNAFSTTEALAENMALMKDKLHAGTARVPISTQLLKPSNPVAEAIDTVNEVKSGGLKRKPSVYYADREAVTSSMNKYKNALSSIAWERISEERGSGDISEMDISSSTDLDNTADLDCSSVFESSVSQEAAPISYSTPRAQTVKTDDDEQIADKENAAEKTPVDTSDKLNTFPATPVNVDISLRTATNKTPVEILKVVKPQRSPVKPLKRLRSPHSPRCSSSRSPKLVRSRQPALSTTLNQGEELNNF